MKCNFWRRTEGKATHLDGNLTSTKASFANPESKMTGHHSKRGPGGEESVNANLPIWDSSDQCSVEKAEVELPNECTAAVKTSKQAVL